MSTNLAYHYTVGLRAEQILESGVIRPATARIDAQEIPVVWFSKAAFFEPTAAKLLVDPATGKSHRASILEMQGHCGGIWRFGIARDCLIPWPALISVARIRSSTARHLERAGHAQGALPSDWLGSLKPVLIADLASIEVLQAGRWQPTVLERAA